MALPFDLHQLGIWWVLSADQLMLGSIQLQPADDALCRVRYEL